jgi:hypothetical protein
MAKLLGDLVGSGRGHGGAFKDCGWKKTNPAAKIYLGSPAFRQRKVFIKKADAVFTGPGVSSALPP